MIGGTTETALMGAGGKCRVNRALSQAGYLKIATHTSHMN